MLKIKLFRKSQGFTFIELLTSLLISMILFGALFTIFLSNIRHYWMSISINQLNQQMQTAMMIMTSEIRRAGYWSNAQSDLGSTTNNNPFMASAVDVTIGTGDSCILFSYDANSNGSLPSISSGSDDERYGFRLNGQALQARPYGASFSCSAAANEWENVTDTNVMQITALTFTLNTYTVATGPGNKSLIQRSVDITMSARLTNDNTITKTITQHVRIMNDKFTNV